MYSKLEIKPSTREAAKIRAVKELIDTERSYNAGLKTLNDAFIYTDAQGPISKEIKDCIIYFKTISDKLLINLDNALKSDISDENRKLLHEERRGLLNAFVQTATRFKLAYDMYLEHIKIHPDTFKALDEYIKDKDLGKSRVGFDALLITPIQRGPRYSLLVKEVSKGAKEDLLLIDMLDNMDEKVKAGLKVINEARKSEPGYQIGDWVLRPVAGWISASIWGTPNPESSQRWEVIDVPDEKEEHESPTSGHSS